MIGQSVYVAFCVVATAACASAACDQSSKDLSRVESFLEREPSAKGSAHAAKVTTPERVKPVDVQRHPAPERLVAIGDLHGDLQATRDVLRLAGAIDAADHWVGGSLVVVQTGDQIDRGDEDKEVLDLLEALQPEAKTAGGALHVLNGNHETMNAAGDFRYVTEKSLASFEGTETRALPRELQSVLPEPAHARARAFLPGGTYAKRLSRRPIVLVVGDSVFVHGGVLPAHVEYGIDRINAEVQRWLGGDGPPPEYVMASDGPLWTRLYSEASPSEKACQTLAGVLERLGARRMVVGHTVQQAGISSACNDRVFRIDVGMSAHYGGGSVAALELRNGIAKPLASPKSKAAPALPAAAE